MRQLARADENCNLRAIMKLLQAISSPPLSICYSMHYVYTVCPRNSDPFYVVTYCKE